MISMKAVKLRTEHMKDPLGIDIRKPYLSWNCAGGIRQTAFQIVAKCDGKILWDSGKVESREMHCIYSGPTDSRQRVIWKVLLWDENGHPGPWSEEAFFEMAFLEKSCWQAKWINPELSLDETKRQPASYLKKTFIAEKPGTSRLYITCHGVYAAYLNGQRVSDFVLAPGTTEYAKRLHYQVYDVTEHLQRGENELMVILGDGWYRGCNGVDGKRNLHGKDIALLCQLEVDEKPIVVSDESWLASQAGAVRQNDLQLGETVDARLETGSDFHGVKVEQFGFDHIQCSNCVPIHTHEQFKPEILTTPNGETVLDFGQNMAGFVGFTLHAEAGQTVKLTHGEALDENGNFTTGNFQPTGRGGHRIAQEIHYTCKDGFNEYLPQFCFFGFQYAKVETNIPLQNIDFTAYAVYSDMERTGFFTCGNTDVNKLVENSVWSQKSNFADIPTDCPTRERAGWSGDAGVFVDTGLYLMDCYPVFRKWLRDLEDIQLPSGSVAFMAPRTDAGKGIAALLNGSAGWGDGAVIVPYALYRMHGDRRILEENYGAMSRWLQFCESRAKKSRLRNCFSKNPHKSYIIDTGFHWGEWCEPDVPTLNCLLHNIFNGAPEIATAYFAYSARLMAEIAEVLGKKADVAHYRNVHEKANAAYHSIALSNGEITSKRQCSFVRPAAFGLLTTEEEKKAVDTLNQMVIDNGYHLNTGFLSTPFLCGVLSEHGYVNTAYRLLLQEECPGWLYEVKHGATTIWETWDGIRADGSPHESLNHYSYGAVCGWLFGNVCGIRVSGTEITIAPQPSPELGFARAEFDSPLGMIRSSWRYEADSVVYEFEIPANCEATVKIHGEEMHILAGCHRFIK